MRTNRGRKREPSRWLISCIPIANCCSSRSVSSAMVLNGMRMAWEPKEVRKVILEQIRSPRWFFRRLGPSETSGLGSQTLTCPSVPSSDRPLAAHRSPSNKNLGQRCHLLVLLYTPFLFSILVLQKDGGRTWWSDVQGADYQAHSSLWDRCSLLNRFFSKSVAPPFFLWHSVREWWRYRRCFGFLSLQLLSWGFHLCLFSPKIKASARFLPCSRKCRGSEGCHFLGHCDGQSEGCVWARNLPGDSQCFVIDWCAFPCFFRRSSWRCSCF